MLNDKTENINAQEVYQPTLPNIAYALRAYALAFWDIAPFGRNVVYTGNVI